MKNFNVIFMTGDGLRHQYTANMLASCLQLCGIISEKKTSNEDYSNLNSDQYNVITDHFARRNSVEKKLLGYQQGFPSSTPLLEVEHGHSNSIDVFNWVLSKKPELIILYGSSIIKQPLLEYYDGRIINMHLGLSPYYRGSGTNFWPLVHGYPECVGATIHLATLDVDAGDILVQVRPDDVLPEDRAHELGTKTIISAVKRMCEVVPAYLNGYIKPVSQDLTLGKIFRRKDFNASSVETMLMNFERGMMEKYLSNKEMHEAKFPIINYWDVLK